MTGNWPLSAEFEIISSILKTAKRIPAYYQSQNIQSFFKTNQTPVTVADCATQIYLIDQIRKHFPNDEIIAEEENSSLDSSMIDQIESAFQFLGLKIEGAYSEIIQYRGRISNRRWTIDPIDGTEGYRRGLAYAIGIGLLIDNLPHFCAIAVPQFKENTDGFFYAEKYHGAFMQFENEPLCRIKIGNCQDPSVAIIVKSLHHDRPISSELIDYFQIQKIISMDGMGKFCQVAMGIADIYFRPFSGYQLYAWDYCPGHLLIEEAGGKCTGLKGEIPIYREKYCLLQSDGIIAASGRLHSNLLEFFLKKST
jgi:3'(2'), 5'-bisphosphate nucleotidase